MRFNPTAAEQYDIDSMNEDELLSFMKLMKYQNTLHDRLHHLLSLNSNTPMAFFAKKAYAGNPKVQLRVVLLSASNQPLSKFDRAERRANGLCIGCAFVAWRIDQPDERDDGTLIKHVREIHFAIAYRIPPSSTPEKDEEFVKTAIEYKARMENIARSIVRRSRSYVNNYDKALKRYNKLLKTNNKAGT